MKKFFSMIICTVFSLTLFSSIPAAYAETVETGMSGFIEYDPENAEINDDETIVIGNDYDYCQEYFYQQLDSVNQYCYEVMKENWDMPTSTVLTISISSPIEYTTVSTSKTSSWTTDDVSNVEALATKSFSNGLTALLLDHPEIFWLDTSEIKFAYGYSVRRSMTETRVYITTLKIQPSISVNYTEGDSDSELENAITAYNDFNDIVSNLEIEGKTDYEKLKSIYYYIASTATYNATSEYNASYSGSVFLNPHYAVCEGYAHAVKVLCDREGIPCVTVGGNYKASTNSGHAWNEVYLDGKWYGADITWDDVDDDTILKYNFFCKGSTNFTPTHTPGSVYRFIEFDYPVLTEDDYSPSSSSTETTVTTTTTAKQSTTTTTSTTVATTTTPKPTTTSTTSTTTTTKPPTTSTTSTTTTTKPTTTTTKPITTSTTTTTTIPTTVKTTTTSTTTTTKPVTTTTTTKQTVTTTILTTTSTTILTTTTKAVTTTTSSTTTVSTTTTPIKSTTILTTTIAKTTTVGTTTTLPTTTSTETTIKNIYGDVNCDGEVTIADVVLINKYIVKTAELSEIGKINADTFNDNNIDAKDSLAILKFLVETIESLPIS